MMNNLSALLVGSLAISLTACAVESAAPEPPVAETAQPLSIFWGGDGPFWGLVGISLNGRSLAGNDLSTLRLEGVSLDGVTLGGRALRATWLDGTVFHGTGPKGDASGKDFVGATFSGLLTGGDALPLRIDGVTVDRSNPISRQIDLYTVSYLADGTWRPLCGADAQGKPVPAIPLAGRWSYASGVAGGGAHIDDPHAFTFACAGFAIAKCVEMGYLPWVTLGKVSVAPYHQACTRAIRADYCGDGTSWTVDGTMIDVYDGYGFRTASPGWPFEAEWNANGAVCAAKERAPSLGTSPCWAKLQSSGCGQSSHFRSGTLLMTQESP